MQENMQAFEAQLRSALADVEPSARLAPEAVAASFSGTRRRNPSVYIVRRVGAMAAAVLVCVLGSMTVLLRTGVLGGMGGASMDSAAMESAAYSAQNSAMDVEIFDSAPAQAPQAPSAGGGEYGMNEAARTEDPAAPVPTADDAEEKAQSEEADFDALVEAEKQRLEAARAKGE